MQQVQRTSTVVIFLINGINSLIGWNTVLAALDFFANAFPGHNVYSFLPIPLFVAYIITGVLYHSISNRFKYVSLILCGNLIVNIALICILLVSIVLKQTDIGFFLLLTCSFVIGIGGNTSQLTFFAMINYLSQNVVSKFTVGTAVSGLMITLVRLVITAAFGSTNQSIAPIVIYFAIAIIFNTCNIILNIRFCKSTVYKKKIDHFLLNRDKDKAGIEPQIDLEQDKPDDKSFKNEAGACINAQNVELQSQRSEPVSQNYISEEARIEGQNYFRTLYQTLTQIMPYPAIIMLTFVVTFTLYPGPTFSKNFPDMDDVWKVIIFNLMYNIGDTAGKYMAQIPGIFNPKSLFFAFVSRLFFIFPISFMAMGSDVDDPSTNNYFFPNFICLLFAITNGFSINASFIMAFRVCPLAYKKYAGVLCGLMLQFGIMLGTVVQIPYSYMIGIN